MNFFEALLLLFPLYPKETQDQIIRILKFYLYVILIISIAVFILYRLACEYERTHPKPPSHPVTALEAVHETDRLNGYIH